MLTGDPLRYPLFPGEPARFVVDCPWGDMTLPAAITPQPPLLSEPLWEALGVPPGPPMLRMGSIMRFEPPAGSFGSCRIEAQIDFGSGYRPFDAFNVSVV